jgi:hypothetical protein
MGYTLRLFTGVKQGLGYVTDISRAAQDWKRTIRLQGGFWQGSFRVEGTLAELQEWFFNRLGYHVEERSGGAVTWEGMIYELELTAHGVRRRRSLEQLRNHVRAAWQRYDGRQMLTDAASNSSSSARYGRKEERISVNGNEATALQQRDVELSRAAWPYPQPVSAARGGGAATLDVQVCGYVFAANWRYVSGDYWDGTQMVNVSDWLAEIAAADCTEFLMITPGLIRTNTVQVSRFIQGSTNLSGATVRVWDFLQELTALGGAAGRPWRLWVDADRRLCYDQVDTTPRYYLRGGEYYTTAGGQTSSEPWAMRPAVVRDLQYPTGRDEPGSLLADTRDMLIEEVEVSANGQISLRTALFGEAEALAAQAEQEARERAWLADYWRRATEADRERRRREWEAQNPGVPFPG